MDEDVAVGANVQQVSAVDGDAGADGNIFFSMSTDANFELYSDSGGNKFLNFCLDAHLEPCTYFFFRI